jgi:hypothetical protein
MSMDVAFARSASLARLFDAMIMHVRVLLFFGAVAAVSTFSASAHAQIAITWGSSTEIASGGGYRGKWQQNESKYDYVDDATVALDRNGAAAVAWVEQRRKDVFFQVFERNGKRRFKQAVNVSRTPTVFSWLPRIVLSPTRANEVFVLWQEIVFSGGSHGGEIFFARSFDSGRTFSAPLNLSRSIGGDGKGRISKDVWHNGSLDLAIGADGALYAAWTEYEGPLWFSRSDDAGNSFSTPLRIAGADSAKPARAPALAIGADKTIFVAWTHGEDESADIHVATSLDGGRTFRAPSVVAQTRGYSDAPKLAVDVEGTVHLVYAESAHGPFDRYHVRYARSHDAGRSFEPARDISQPHPSGIVSAAFPHLSLDGRGHVYVAWEIFADVREPPRGLAFAVSFDRGERFTAPTVVPASIDPSGGGNGSHQGLLMRKLAVNADSEIAVVNSSLKHGERSRVWLIRGRSLPR